MNGQEEKAESEEKDKVTLGGGSQVQLATHGILGGRGWKIVEGIIGCINNWHFKGAGEMTPQLRAQAALSEDPHLMPSTHMASKYRPWGSTPPSRSL